MNLKSRGSALPKRDLEKKFKFTSHTQVLPHVQPCLIPSNYSLILLLILSHSQAISGINRKRKFFNLKIIFFRERSSERNRK
jgi:hypothetical protein